MCACVMKWLVASPCVEKQDRRGNINVGVCKHDKVREWNESCVQCDFPIKRIVWMSWNEFSVVGLPASEQASNALYIPLVVVISWDNGYAWVQLGVPESGRNVVRKMN